MGDFRTGGQHFLWCGSPQSLKYHEIIGYDGAGLPSIQGLVSALPSDASLTPLLRFLHAAHALNSFKMGNRIKKVQNDRRTYFGANCWFTAYWLATEGGVANVSKDTVMGRNTSAVRTMKLSWKGPA